MSIKELLLNTGCFEENQYLDEYVSLIEQNISTAPEKFKTQRHHIVPQQCYKHLGYDMVADKPFIDRSSNLVNLLYKDHIKAHYYLSLCASDGDVRYANLYSFYRMVHTNPHKFDMSDLNLLEHFQQLQEEYQRENSHRATKRLTGTTVSDETKRKIGATNKKRYTSIKYVFIHKGTVNKKCPESELETYLNDGWERGRNDPECFAKISMTQRSSPNRSMLGRRQSEHQKEVMRNLMTGARMPDTARESMSRARRGKILISNNETMESFYVTETEYEEIYRDKGFYNGRLKNKGR